MDATGGLWQKGALHGKPAACFVSTATQGGGQETIGLSMVTFFTHHGMPFVPLGFKDPKMFSYDEVHGGSPYGAGTIAGSDGSRQPSQLEKDVARTHGTHFASIVTKLSSSSVSI
jgi:NAD(P)H dehydrogenase (quinone)